MFDAIPTAPPDSILGLSEAFAKDPRPGKINLAVGVFKDAQGRTPVLASVKAAEQRLIETETTKGYKPIDGDPKYAQVVTEMLLGEGHEVVSAGRVATADTPGGTGALRVAADFIHAQLPGATIWMSDPTWANHPQIFAAAGVPTRTYPYFDAANNALAFGPMLDALRRIPRGDVVLLHGCCHNPTGVDLSIDQWKQVAEVCQAGGLLPFVDFAYQGFGTGLREDAAWLGAMLGPATQMLICSSFSKNFGLYNERVGALTAVTASRAVTEAVLSQIKTTIRANYSNPPAHGASVVTTIMGDAALRRQWEGELAAMRGRINNMRKAFAVALDHRSVKLSPRGNGFITEQKGMFSFSGLNKQQVQKLKDDFAIYIVGSGRINVAGMTDDTMDVLCDAIASVTK
jgi:aspartate/tyrosine/aromatic aminotransferase